MASSITALSTAVSSSTSLVASASAPMSTQASIHIIKPNDRSGNDFLFGNIYQSLGAPVAGVLLTVEQAIEFGTFGRSFYYSEGQLFQGPFLTSTDCYMVEGSAQTRNCSESCVQPASIFSNTSTLANCMALPLITDLIVSGDLSDTSESTADLYGIGGNRTLALQVNNTLSGCFRAFCQQSIPCKRYGFQEIFGNHSTLVAQGTHICTGVEQTVLGDIAGIGVCVMN